MVKNYAIIENDKVVNVALAESALAANWVQSDTAKIGDDYIGGEFVTPNPEDPDIDPKMIGVEILGVMCSATKNDQNGLTAVALGVTLARSAATTFPDTVFSFENNNELVITDSNFDAVYAAWTPFRQSFFAVEV